MGTDRNQSVHEREPKAVNRATDDHATRFYYLTPVLGGPGAPRYPVTEQRQVIGRSEEADVALLEPTVSRRHASMTVEEGVCWLEDLQSKHGTFVNSRRVQRVRLKPGDIVVFGLSIVLRLETADAPVPPAMPLRVPGGGLRVDSGRQLETRSRANPFMSRTASAEPGVYPPMSRVSLTQPSSTITNGQRSHLHKVAGAGLFCLVTLPTLLQRAEELGRQLDRLASPDDHEGEDSAPDPVELADQLDRIRTGLRRMTEALGVASSPTIKPTPLQSAIQRALETVTSRSDGDDSYQVELRLDGSLVVHSDPEELARALAELLDVAIRCSFDGSTVILSATESVKGARISLEFPGDTLTDELIDALARPLRPVDQWHRLGVGFFEARQTLMAHGGTVTLSRGQKDRYAIDVVLPGAVL